MGFFKNLFGLSKEDRPVRSERIRIDGNEERSVIHDGKGHWQEEHRWNPGTGRTDILDHRGTVIGHIQRDPLGNDVRTDIHGNVIQVDKRKDRGTVEHYDAKGRKTGYTTRDRSNNVTRHIYTGTKTTSSRSKGSTTGILFLDILADSVRKQRK